MTGTAHVMRLHERHLLAVGARLALLLSAAMLIIAAVKPPPRLIYSYHAQHLAAFYVLSLCSATAFKKTKVLTLATVLAVVAVLFEGVRSLDPLHARTAYANGLADASGILGALAPMLAQKFRVRFDEAPPSEAFGGGPQPSVGQGDDQRLAGLQRDGELPG